MQLYKKLIFILIAYILPIIVFLPVNAEEIKDYRKIIYKTATFENVFKPTAYLGIKLNNNPEVLSYTGVDTGYSIPPLVVIKAKVGDKITVYDHSKSNYGSNIDLWDYQVSIPNQGMTAHLYDSTAFSSDRAFKDYTNYTLTESGTYNFYLCVRDYLSSADKLSITSGYGNWSENGNHQALGINPGPDGIKGNADDFQGYWYYTQIRVVVEQAGAGTIIVHYKDDKGVTLAPDDTIKTDLDKPTTIYPIPILNYKADKASDIVTVPSTDADKTVEYTFTYIYSPSLLPPNVSIDCYDTVVMGNDITINANGTDPQNNPISYHWTASPSYWLQGALEGTSSTVWFNQVGTVNIALTGTTAGGSDTDTKDIRVVPPIPQVILDSPLSIRTNHRLTVDASKSTGGSQRYGIDWLKAVWEISITDNSKGLTFDDIKTLLPYTIITNSQGKQIMKITGDYKKIDILLKKPGKLNVYNSLTNIAGYIGFANREVEVLPDLAPTIGISVTKETLRDPNDSNLASIDLIDTSTSPDGDPIGKRVWFYAFDSDNDSSFTDEAWYVLDNDTWQPAISYGVSGSYQSLKGIDIDLIHDGNKPMVLFKADHVGKRMFELIVRERLDNANSITEFIMTNDMQKSDTFN